MVDLTLLTTLFLECNPLVSLEATGMLVMGVTLQTFSFSAYYFPVCPIELNQLKILSWISHFLTYMSLHFMVLIIL